MADVLRLCDLPGDFGECFLPYRATLRQRVQAKKYSNESYVNFVKLFRGDSSIHLKAGVFRSQRKSEEPHRVTLEIGEQTILEAHCTCKAGYTMILVHLFLLTAAIMGCQCYSQSHLYLRESTFADLMCPTEQVHFQSVVHNPIWCVRECADQPACRSLIYLHDNQTCFGLKADNPFNATSPLPGAVFYRYHTAITTTSATTSTAAATTTAQSTSTATTTTATTTTTTPTTATTTPTTTTTTPTTTTTTPTTTTTTPTTTTTTPTTTTTTPTTTTTTPTTTTTTPTTTTTTPTTTTTTPTTTTTTPTTTTTTPTTTTTTPTTTTTTPTTTTTTPTTTTTTPTTTTTTPTTTTTTPTTTTTTPTTTTTTPTTTTTTPTTTTTTPTTTTTTPTTTTTTPTTTTTTPPTTTTTATTTTTTPTTTTTTPITTTTTPTTTTTTPTTTTTTPTTTTTTPTTTTTTPTTTTTTPTTTTTTPTTTTTTPTTTTTTPTTTTTTPTTTTTTPTTTTTTPTTTTTTPTTTTTTPTTTTTTPTTTTTTPTTTTTTPTTTTTTPTTTTTTPTTTTTTPTTTTTTPTTTTTTPTATTTTPTTTTTTPTTTTTTPTTTTTTPTTTPTTTTTTTPTTTPTPMSDPGSPVVAGLLDSQFTASGTLDMSHRPWHSRIDNGASCWRPSTANQQQWVQVDFGDYRLVTHVVTKGNPAIDNYYVALYKVLISTDCTTFVTVKDGSGIDKIFDGNEDKTSAVQNSLDPPVVCRCFRINPWGVMGTIALRFDVLVHEITQGSPMVATLDNSKFSATSIYGSGYEAWQARLDNMASCWRPATQAQDEWVWIEFDGPMLATHVVTMGNPNNTSWVATYWVWTSGDCFGFSVIKDAGGVAKVFNGNSDGVTAVQNALDPPVVARCFMIQPRTGPANGYIDLRFEVHVHEV